MELTFALGQTAGGVSSLLAGLRVSADGGAEFALRATVLEIPLGGAEPARVLPDASLDLHAPRRGSTNLLVDKNGLRVRSLRAGLDWDGTTLKPALELEDVKLPGVTAPFALLDLTSADTLASTATAIIEDAIKSVLGETGLARPLLTLLGLDPAAGPTVDLVDLATRPLAALAAYHRRAFTQPTGWKPQLAAIADLLGLDAATVAIPGAGRSADPWTVAIPALSDATVKVAVQAWDATPSGTTRSLRLALGFTLADTGAGPCSCSRRRSLATTCGSRC